MTTPASSALAKFCEFIAPASSADARAAAFQSPAFAAVRPLLGHRLRTSERRLLNLRYGHVAGRALPMGVISKLTGLPVEVLRGIEAGAFKRLKRPNLLRLARRGRAAA